MSAPGAEAPKDPVGLDQLDELLTCFRPIEKLFHLMGAVDPDASGGAALVRECSEVGLHLSERYREALARVFRRRGEER